MNTRWDVVGVGANSVDYVYRLPAYPQPDSPTAKMRIGSHLISCGGQVATALCTCAVMGLRTTYIGALGNDDNGRRMHDELARRGVDTAHVVVRDAINPFAVILLDEQQGERVVLWERDPTLTLQPEEIDPSVIRASRLVHVDDVDVEASIRAATLAREKGIPVTSDIERVTDRTEALIHLVTVPIFAERVVETLTGELDVEQGLRALRRRHAGLLCVTLGPRGAMVLEDDRLHHEPAHPVAAIDTTGAGDVFRGAFIYALLRGDRPPDILRFANTAAAISCTRLGAIAGVPMLQEVEALAGKSTKTV
ncbi:MAG: hypothetical protein HY657_18045 [Acidobacteria bacterium]|nr:hypothetical protein [Acidobacteriota bacterium]